MWLARVSLVCLLTVISVGPGWTQNDIVTLRAENLGKADADVAVTFGAVFARGDLPRGSGLEAFGRDEKQIPLQIDLKARHQDGSARHAVITLVFPRFSSGTEMPIVFRRVAASAVEGQKHAVTLAELPKDFDTSVILTQGSHRLTASAAPLLSRGKIETWLRGPYVSEWWVSGPFRDESGKADPHLTAQFGVRCYGIGRPLRVDVIVENDWTFVGHPHAEIYDAEIRSGSNTVFQQAGIVQFSQTRWRRGFWLGRPVSAYVEQNLEYLKKARVIPNYDPDLEIPRTLAMKAYERFEASDRRPMAPGIITAYMPTTGGRADIAPLPQWQTIYLLTMDPSAYEVMLQTTDLGAGFPAHYRNEKTGRPTTPEDYPQMSTVSDIFGQPGQPEPRDDLGHKDTLVPDPAHEPALDFLPYLVTGDRFYLEELQFWSMWNALFSGPQYRGYGAGLLYSRQVRGQAWSLRTLAQAEYITPDTDPLKPLLRRELKANVEWYDRSYSRNPAANRIGIIEREDGYDENRSMAPWQDDYFTWSLGYVQGLGDVDAEALLRWKAKFPVGRIVAPGFCWVLATSYTLRVRDRADGPTYPSFADVYRKSLEENSKGSNGADMACGSAGLSDALGLARAGDMLQGNYGAVMRPALAASVDAGVEGASAAWRLFQLHAPPPDPMTEPEWDIVPIGQPEPTATNSK